MSSYTKHLIILAGVSLAVAVVPAHPVFSYALYGYIAGMACVAFLMQFDPIVEKVAIKRYKKANPPLADIALFPHTLFHTAEVTLFLAAGWTSTAYVWALLALTSEFSLYQVKNLYNKFEAGKLDPNKLGIVGQEFDAGEYITQHDLPPNRETLGFNKLDYIAFQNRATEPGVEPKCDYQTIGTFKSIPVRVFGQADNAQKALTVCALLSAGLKLSGPELGPDVDYVEEIRFHARYPSYAYNQAAGMFSGTDGVIDVHNLKNDGILNLAKTLLHELTHADDRKNNYQFYTILTSIIDKAFNTEINEQHPRANEQKLGQVLIQFALNGLCTEYEEDINTSKTLAYTPKDELAREREHQFKSSTLEYVSNLKSERVQKWLNNFATYHKQYILYHCPDKNKPLCKNNERSKTTSRTA